MEVLPRIPTDNLYKFIAMSGIALIIFSCVTAFINASRREGIIDEIKAKMDMRDAYLNIAKDYKKTIDVIGNVGTISEMHNKAIDKANKFANELTDRVYVLETIVEQRNVTYIMSFVSSFVGTILACVGFLLWYKKLQIYQDAIIKREAENLRGDE